MNKLNYIDQAATYKRSIASKYLSATEEEIIPNVRRD